MHNIVGDSAPEAPLTLTALWGAAAANQCRFVGTKLIARSAVPLHVDIGSGPKIFALRSGS